jgi:hypothetical protein
MKSLTLKRTLLWLVVIFVIVFIYRQPDQASATIGPFLGDVGNILSRVVHSGAEFLSGLAS